MNDNELFIDGQELPQPLKDSELVGLFSRLSNGEFTARDKLVNHNIRLVIHIVINKFKNVNYDKKDLVSVGTIGLMKAVDSFKVEQNIKFVTYATKCIENEILMFLRKIKNDSMISSLNDVIVSDKDDNDLTLEDIISDDNDFVDDVIKDEIGVILRRIVDEFSYPKNEIIKLYFGFYNDECYNQVEIGKLLNLSQSYISRLIKKVIKKVKIKLYENNIIELNDVEKKELNYICNETKKEVIVLKETVIESKKEKGEKKMSKNLKSIYQYFEDYSKEQVDNMLTKLDKEDLDLIELRYTSTVGTSEYLEVYKQFYNRLVPKMKKILSNPDYQMKKTSKNIYEYFSNYSKEEVDEMLEKLSNNERVIIKLKYDNNTKVGSETNKIFYASLVPKMKRLLKNKTIRKYTRKVKEKLEVESNTELKDKNVLDVGEIRVKEEEIQKVEEIVSEEKKDLYEDTKEVTEEKVQDNYSIKTIINKNDNEITEEDYVRLVKLLSEPNFVNMMNVYTPNEVMIVSLKLGLVNNKCFTTEEISNFLGIEPDVIRNVTKKVLNDYKERLNNLIDFAIDKIVEEDITLKLKK